MDGMDGLLTTVIVMIILTALCMIITICWAVWQNYRGKWRYRGGRLRRHSLNVCVMPSRSPINVHNRTESGMGPNDPLPVGFKDVQPDPFEALRIPPPYPKHMPYIPNTVAAAPYSEASMREAAASLVPTAPPASPDDPCPQNNVAAPPFSVAAPPYPVADPPNPVAGPPYPVAGPPYPVAVADEGQHEPYLPVLKPAPTPGWLLSSTPTTKEPASPKPPSERATPAATGDERSQNEST